MKSPRPGLGKSCVGGGSYQNTMEVLRCSRSDRCIPPSWSMGFLHRRYTARRGAFGRFGHGGTALHRWPGRRRSSPGASDINRGSQNPGQPRGTNRWSGALVSAILSPWREPTTRARRWKAPPTLLILTLFRPTLAAGWSLPGFILFATTKRRAGGAQAKAFVFNGLHMQSYSGSQILADGQPVGSGHGLDLGLGERYRPSELS